MNQQQLKEVYQMVDSIAFSRPKKNINRDFSDGRMMAQLIAHYYPKIISVHNYPPANSLNKKIDNWNMLNTKVLRKLGIVLSKNQIQKITNAVPSSVEEVLYQVLVKFQKPDQQGRLIQNAKRVQNQRGLQEQQFVQGGLILNTENGVHGQSLNNFNDRTYNPQPNRNQDEEQIQELMSRIQQVYAQLHKLQQLNKVKEDIIRNLQKKLQKVIFS